MICPKCQKKRKVESMSIRDRIDRKHEILIFYICNKCYYEEKKVIKKWLEPILE